MTELKDKRCEACEGAIKPMSHDQITHLLQQIPLWEVNETETLIQRRFAFKNFYRTMAFVNAIAWIAHQENHHPDVELGYNYCLIKYSTHAINGLSINDFICAAKIDGLEK
jgi:4a-hydroxytetrahydrobiopterin dehydratase